MSAPIHATVVALFTTDGWRGALLRGPSGAGKSDLALRLIARGWRLVGDDYVHVFAASGVLYAAPADRIAGQVEARGLGVLAVEHRALTRVHLVVDCVQAPVERMPDLVPARIEGVAVPTLALDVRPSSAPVTLGHAIRRL